MRRHYFWDAYNEIVRDMVRGHVAQLRKHQREAVWLQTDAFSDWECAHHPGGRDANPVFNDDIVDYLVRNYIYSQAADWSNARTEAYLSRSRMRD